MASGLGRSWLAPARLACQAADVASEMHSPRLSLARRLLRWLLALLAGVALLALLVALGAWLSLRLSLAQLDGRVREPGLSAAVAVERDALGTPSVTASNRLDLARATGFLHAQDRFFQMDLLRRRAGGELAELFGPALIGRDRSARQHRLRAVAEAALAASDPTARALLTAYSEGVNAGLAALRVRPPEYLLLRQAPRPWQPQDCVLVVHSIGLELNDSFGSSEVDIALAQQALPSAAVEFYLRRDSGCDAPLDGTMLPRPRLPSPEEFDLRSSATNRQAEPGRQREFIPGSNAWAVNGRRTGTGSGMLANDMHLGLSLPNTWYRMQFVWRDPDGTERRVTGATLPGTPAMVVGSNGRVAWGMTAAQLDVADQVVLELDPARPNGCRVGAGWQPFVVSHEVLRVAGRTNVPIEIVSSPWGPVGTNRLGQTVGFRWAMQLPEAANLGSLGFERAANVQEILNLAPRCGLPWVNVIAADREGNIGWTLGGRFPRRVGLDGRTPTSWADGLRGWQGWASGEEVPQVLNPPSGAVWNANNRALGSEAYLRLMGEDNTDNGARARQIRDQLLALTNARPADFLAIQLDDRALFLEPWQRRLRDSLASVTNDSRFAEARTHITSWGGRAAVDSVGYRLVRDFRRRVIGLLLGPVEQRCRAFNRRFSRLPGHPDGVVQDLLEQRPAHLLPRPFTAYDELLAAAARQTLESLPKGRPLAEYTWGRRNRVTIRHPFSQAMPRLSRWLDIPERSLPGDAHIPRAQGPDFGASERMVVSPGHEAEGIYHMPGGQSGHFLSPFYRAGHEDWAEGKPSPFLPGPARHHLALRP
jgi:penicillin G amidase